MNINTSIFKLPTPLAHYTIAHKVCTIYSAHSSMNFRCTNTFCLQESNNTPQFTLGGRINFTSHIEVSPDQFGMVAEVTVEGVRSRLPRIVASYRSTDYFTP
uniref:Uncharacterized protein n=1 Tax=Graphocephala atropunctata TaxID=36148 RepID=A0A1B6MI39_9HEMI